jgi:hypothetical protein
VDGQGEQGSSSTVNQAPLPPAAGTTPIKAGYNPATWMLEVTGGSMATTATANNVDCECACAHLPPAPLRGTLLRVFGDGAHVRLAGVCDAQPELLC